MAIFLFDTEITLFSTLPNNQELSLALGSKTLVHWTSSQSLTFIGLSVSGAVPSDKLVVCFSNVNGSNGFSQSFAHDSSSTTNAAFRFLNKSLTTANGGTGIGAIWYEYYATAQRWIQVGGTG